MRMYRSILAVLASTVLAPMVAGAGLTQAIGSYGLYLAEDQNLDRGVHFVHSDRDLGYFGDEASSVRNEDSVAWVLFDDDGYRDRRFCIRPEETVNNLHASPWKFGDKTSSILRLADESCRSYPAFYG